MADDEAPPPRSLHCLRRYHWNGHTAWCLKPDGHEGECGEGVLSGKPHARPNFMPRKP